MSITIARMPFTVGAAQLSSAANPTPPLPKVELYVAPGDDPGPALAYDRLKGSGRIYRMDILAGQHSAITLEGSRGEPLSSNNHFNAVPGSPDVWIDHDPQAERRHIFFHGRREPLHPGSNARSLPQVSLFQIGTALDRPTVLQVRVFDPRGIRRGIVLVKLYGHSMVLNAIDTKKPIVPYRMDETLAVAGEPFRDVVSIVLAKISKNGPLDHLVLNAHGKMYGAEQPREEDRHIAIHLGRGLSRADHEEWKRLRGKVRYIWFQNCMVAMDRKFCARVAHSTEAFVSAYRTDTPNAPSGIPSHHIDVLMPSLLVWDHALCDPDFGRIKPAGEETFWRQARFASQPDLRSSLRFNMMKLL